MMFYTQARRRTQLEQQTSACFRGQLLHEIGYRSTVISNTGILAYFAEYTRVQIYRATRLPS